MKAKDFFTVLNDKGLHTRPATEIVKLMRTFNSQVIFIYRGVTANAKSILDILMLAAPRGAKIEVEAEGEDAEAVILAIQELAKNKFCSQY